MCSPAPKCSTIYYRSSWNFSKAARKCPLSQRASLLSPQAGRLRPELPLYFGENLALPILTLQWAVEARFNKTAHPWTSFFFFPPTPINTKISFSFPPVLLDERPDVATWVTFLSFKKEWLKQGKMMVRFFFFFNAKEGWAGSLPLTMRNGEASRSHTKLISTQQEKQLSSHSSHLKWNNLLCEVMGFLMLKAFSKYLVNFFWIGNQCNRMKFKRNKNTRCLSSSTLLFLRYSFFFWRGKLHHLVFNQRPDLSVRNTV